MNLKPFKAKRSQIMRVSPRFENEVNELYIKFIQLGMSVNKTDITDKIGQRLRDMDLINDIINSKRRRNDKV